MRLAALTTSYRPTYGDCRSNKPEQGGNNGGTEYVRLVPSFAWMTGLGERVARSLLSRLLASRLLESDGPCAPVRMGFPLHALQFLLPGLYPEAATPPD